MSEAITEAEQRLALCLEAMRDALQFTIEDALPQSTLGDLVTGTAEDMEAAGNAEDIPDTLRQSLQYEHTEEVRRISDQACEVQRRVEALRRAVVALGGGNPMQPIMAGSPVVDVPVEVLDTEIATLSAESTRLGQRMVERYDEAKALAHRLESEITNADIPAL